MLCILKNWIVFAQMKQETCYIFTVSCIMSLEYDILLPNGFCFLIEIKYFHLFCMSKQ